MEEVESLKKEVQSLQAEIAATRVEIAATREEMKERETSIFRGIRTIIVDFNAFVKRERDFPKSALIGLLGAYLTPRILIVIGSLAAGMGTFFQGWLIIRQNDLIEEQGRMLEMQTKSSEFQSRVGLLSMLDPKDPFKSSIALAEAADHPQLVDKTLFALADSKEYGELGIVACRHLMAKEKPTLQEFVLTLSALTSQIKITTEAYEGSATCWLGEEDPKLPSAGFVREISTYIRKIAQLHSEDLRKNGFGELEQPIFNALAWLDMAIVPFLAKTTVEKPILESAGIIILKSSTRVFESRGGYEKDFASAVIELCATASNRTVEVPDDQLPKPIEMFLILAKRQKGMTEFLKKFD